MSAKRKPTPQELETRFQEGNQLATVNRGRIRKGTSKIRQTLNRIQEMEDYAIDIIQTSLQQQDVENKSLETAKWLITTMVSLNRAAIADEQLSFNSRMQSRELQAREQEAELQRQMMEQGLQNGGNVIRFSTKMLPQEVDNDEDDE